MLAIAGCASAALQVTPVSSMPQRPSRSVAQIRVFQGEPDQPYRVVEDVYYDWTRDGIATNVNMAMAAVRERAAALGADCVMNVVEERNLGPVSESTVRAKICIFDGQGQRPPGDLRTATPGAAAQSADDPVPRPAAFARPRAVALVIGIEHYRGEELPVATGAGGDAKLFADFAEKTLGVPREGIHLLTDAAATKSSIDAELHEWLPKNVSTTGEVFVYFAGHGAPDPSSGRRYLLPWDGVPKFVASQGVAVESLMDRLSGLRAARVYVFLDACFSGAGGRSVLPAGARPILIERRPPRAPTRQSVTLFTATGPNEITGATPSGRGLFSYYLLRGMNGDADADGDGRVTVGELATYAARHVADDARRQNRDQKPQLLAAPASRSAVLAQPVR
jgi:hypothetical protein